jgi:hypothetical protein
VVCEGRETEPNYFNALRSAYNLSSANVKACPSDFGNDPVSVVAFAERELDQNPDYTRAYCVFDRDGHANYADAIARLANSPHSRIGRLFVANSVPCFEIWLLLHYRFSTAPIVPAGGFSAADVTIRELRTHFPNYEKNRRDIFSVTCDKIEIAVAHAARLMRDNATSGADNPATRVHELVDYLRGLRRNPNG